MARTIQDVEAFLLATGRPFEKNEDGTFLLVPQGEIQPVMAIRVDGPAVTITLEIGPAPAPDAPNQTALLRRLLEFNASDLLYCAYGLRGDSIVLSAGHELENLDMNEIQAMLSDIEMALSRHIKELVALSESAGGEK